MKPQQKYEPPNYRNALREVRDLNLESFIWSDLGRIVEKNHLPSGIFHVRKSNGKPQHTTIDRYNELKLNLEVYVHKNNKRDDNEDDDEDYTPPLFDNDDNDHELLERCTVIEPIVPSMDTGGELIIEIVETMMSDHYNKEHYQKFMSKLNRNRLEWEKPLIEVIEGYNSMIKKCFRSLTKSNDPFLKLMEINSIKSIVSAILRNKKDDKYKSKSVNEMYKRSENSYRTIYMWEYIGKVGILHRKSYVGQAVDLRKRTNQHITEAFSSSNKGCRCLNWAIRMSTSNDWSIIVLERDLTDKMNERETHHITEHQTMLSENGLNMKKMK